MFKLLLIIRSNPLSKISKFWVIALLISASSTAISDPWIEPGNERARHHIQNLVDSGASTILVTSWPLMWSNVKAGLQNVDPSRLTPSQLWSYQYLKHELRQEIRPLVTEQSGFISSNLPEIRDFSSDAREKQEASISFSYTGNKTAIKLKATHANNALDQKTLRMDGSSISYLFKNWAIGAGAIDRWWGPGWESSMIMSHNARPRPSLFIQRNLAEPFQTRWLSLLGPWQLTTHMSKLESNRATPNALIWGMRINLRPLKTLEIGLSRTAMWGGDGRPHDVDTFINLLAGRDNFGSAGIEEDRSNEPGNQLAGVDLRWGSHIGSINTAVYGQLIGEDEANGMPSRHIGMAGIELNTLIKDTQARINIEAKNSTVYFYDSEKNAPNVAYEHPLYENGYRYRGLPIGASTDNDTESLSVRAQLFFRNGHFANIAIAKHNINKDGTTRNRPGGNVFGDSATKTYQTQAHYSAPISKSILLKAGIFHFSKSITVREQTITSGVFIQLNTRW